MPKHNPPQDFEDRLISPPRKYANDKAIISLQGVSSKQFVHPNHPWINGNLNVSNHPKGFTPTQTVKDNIDAIFHMQSCIVSLLILYQDGKTNFASAFRVAPKTYLTAKHYMYPSEITDQAVQALYISSVVNTSEVYYLDEVDLEKYGYVVCKILSVGGDDYKMLRAGKDPNAGMSIDIDPVSGLMLDIIADFLVIEPLENVGLEDNFMLPYWPQVEEQSQMAVVGYNLPIDPKYLQRMYGDNEDAVISERKLQKVFFGYCLKSLSPGYIGKNNDKLFTHLCSNTPGSSGSACVLIDRFYKEDKVYPLFIGVHMGSWTKVQVENNNYNLALAIRHPLFVKAYNEFVLPKLPESLREQFK